MINKPYPVKEICFLDATTPDYLSRLKLNNLNQEEKIIEKAINGDARDEVLASKFKIDITREDIRTLMMMICRKYTP